MSEAERVGKAAVAPARANAPPAAQPLQTGMFGFGALLLTLSTITPAASVFIIGSQVIAQAGSGAAWSFLIAAVVCVPVALIYAELSSAFPLTGQEYTMVGAVLGPSWGFMALGINIVGGAFTQAVTALGLALYLGVAIPGAPMLPTALVAMLVATLIPILNVRFNALVTGLFLAAEMAALLAVAWLGAVHMRPEAARILMHPDVLGAAGNLTRAPVSLIVLGAAGAIFAYNGFGAAASFGEETHDPRRSIAAVVLWALAITVAAEVLPVLALLIASGDTPGVIGAASPVRAFIALGGGPFAKVVSLGVALAIVNAMIATTLINARQLYATGRDAVWPAAWNRQLTRTHGRFNSPWVATLVSGALAGAMCFVPLATLVVLTATGIIGTYILVAVSALAGRATGSTDHGHYRMPLFPLGPILALAALVAIVWGDWLDPASGRPSLIANLAIMGGFALYYLVFLRGRRAFALRGPEGAL
ncbi:MAG TPA: APC family permease [Caulobacteraceae bacterium]|nr:APC family permease [Caulobacteraceae bacterium]